MSDEPAHHADETGEIVVFSIIKDRECTECGEELPSGSLLRMEKNKPLCLGCADLDHLSYLPRGDAALTRRASKLSPLRAVVLRWSRSRKRYERQGILVTQAAIEEAEQQCLADADLRARRQERAAERRTVEDAAFIASFEQRIRELFPKCPPAESASIAAHACQKHSGRVGRSAAAKELDEQAVTLAVRAHIRHVHTKYDEMLSGGVDRSEARELVLDKVDAVFEKWRAE